MSNAVQMNNITKSFSGIAVLNGVDLTVAAGEVVALMGENGAGKSTLMKILCGVHEPDSGSIFVNGKEEKVPTPRKAFSIGIRAVHQELSLVDHLTVASNIFLGQEPSRFGFIDHAKMQQMSQAILDRNGFELDAGHKVGDLSIANKQLVEIAKAIFDDTKTLILDEPTSALTKKEVERLFKVVALLKQKGVSIVYISHKLNEVVQIADRVVVLKDGQNSGELPIENVTEDKIVRMMVGRDIVYSHTGAGKVSDESVLKVEGVSSIAVNDINFDLRKGEILGVAGLMGSGRTELLETLFGKRKLLQGSVWLKGQKINNASPRHSIKSGFAFATEDRKGNGLVLDMSVKRNVSLPSLNRYVKFGFINETARTKNSEENVRSFNVKTSGVNQLVRNLSGGNQQKVVLSKWINIRPTIFLIDEPTRGIDVGAKAEIYQLLRNLASDGISIIMVSSELPEILALSDRVLVMKGGSVAGILDRSAASEESVLMLATKGENLNGNG